MQCKETGAGRSYQLIMNTCTYFLNLLFLNNKFVEGVTFFGLSEGGLLGQIGPPWRSMTTTSSCQTQAKIAKFAKLDFFHKF